MEPRSESFMGAFKDSLKKAKENTNKPISNPISDVEKSYNQRLNDADKLSNEIKKVKNGK